MGSGGREHALAWKLAQEAEVFAAPGNPGIATVGDCFPFKPNDHASLRILCKSLQPDLVLIGPEDPLIAGLADELRTDRFAVFGPGASGARLEGSKAFSKEIMAKSGVPTARAVSFTEPAPAKEFARSLNGVVIKASGAALGKGVVVCNSIEEADEAIDAMLVEKSLGEAGSTILVEEKLTGKEFSLITIVSGKHFTSLPVAQDYKRALDNDRGPNTGGMGTYSPVPWVSDELVKKTEAAIVAPTVRNLNKSGIDFRGVLFSGIMVQDGKPYCLEYNVRFGDPETQTIMMRLGSGLSGLLFAAAIGEILAPMPVKDDAAVSVVVASGGYPGPYEPGKAVTLPATLPENVQIFHAGTQRVQGQLMTAGGRVLSVSATGATITLARETAYRVCEGIGFDGMYYRKDIAAEAVSVR
ncbi:MAG TPA: phosphoribosylamine--glycine ligase [Fimbriimonadaceae bacterium]